MALGHTTIELVIRPATDQERADAAANDATTVLREIAKDRDRYTGDVRIAAAEAILRHYRHYNS